MQKERPFKLENRPPLYFWCPTAILCLLSPMPAQRTQIMERALCASGFQFSQLHSWTKGEQADRHLSLDLPENSDRCLINATHVLKAVLQRLWPKMIAMNVARQGEFINSSLHDHHLKMCEPQTARMCLQQSVDVETEACKGSILCSSLLIT